MWQTNWVNVALGYGRSWSLDLVRMAAVERNRLKGYFGFKIYRFGVMDSCERWRRGMG